MGYDLALYKPYNCYSIKEACVSQFKTDMKCTIDIISKNKNNHFWSETNISLLSFLLCLNYWAEAFKNALFCSNFGLNQFQVLECFIINQTIIINDFDFQDT